MYKFVCACICTIFAFKHVLYIVVGTHSCVYVYRIIITIMHEPNLLY